MAARWGSSVESMLEVARPIRRDLFCLRVESWVHTMCTSSKLPEFDMAIRESAAKYPGREHCHVFAVCTAELCSVACCSTAHGPCLLELIELQELLELLVDLLSLLLSGVLVASVWLCLPGTRFGSLGLS